LREVEYGGVTVEEITVAKQGRGCSRQFVRLQRTQGDDDYRQGGALELDGLGDLVCSLHGLVARAGLV